MNMRMVECIDSVVFFFVDVVLVCEVREMELRERS